MQIVEGQSHRHCSSVNPIVPRHEREGLHRPIALALCLMMVSFASPAVAGSSEVESSILEIPSSVEGVHLRFPVYQQGDVRYFSAGVGVEERQAVYPPYALKLIFVQGPRAYLADVTITILKSDGTPLAEIPSDHVMGPWLFVNLPAGTYTVKATDAHQRTITRKVVAGEGPTRSVYFRWPAVS